MMSNGHQHDIVDRWLELLGGQRHVWKHGHRRDV